MNVKQDGFNCNSTKGGSTAGELVIIAAKGL